MSRARNIYQGILYPLASHRKQLRSLDLTGNRIAALEPLGVLPDLRKLAASDNAPLGDDGMVDGGWWMVDGALTSFLFFLHPALDDRSWQLCLSGVEICWNC